MFILSICGDNLHDGTRTILKQLRPKLCKNLRTTNLGQNLLVLQYKKKRVPQGTVLARLLFLLFIDDIESLTNIDSQMRLFADDCLVHRVIKRRFGLSAAAGRYFLALSFGKHMEDDL